MRINYMLVSSLIIFLNMPALCQVKLPQMVRDSMVLQRDAKVKIWGWASPNEKIKINFLKKKYTTAADERGDWMVVLSPSKAGGPFTMAIDAKNHIVLDNILIGDVWLCSGQSNMVHQMELHKYTYAKEIAEADYPEIRQFWIPALTNLQKPEMDLPAGYWKSANPKDVLRFSAVAYFFGKALYEKYHVPIGLINSSVGGTPIEAWTSEEGLKEFPFIEHTIDKNKDTMYVNGTNRKAFAMNASRRSIDDDDKGLAGDTKWFDTSYIPKEWYRINIPGYWEDQGIKDLNGVVWYRREIDVPAFMTGVSATLFMGRIVDADFVYINGNLVGKTTYQYPQRRYDLPAGVLKPGKNLIVIRVINHMGKGGFVPDKPYYIFTGKDTIDLKGYWQYKVGEAFTRHLNTEAGISVQNQPTALYNAMVAPLTNFAIKGILWYQGESNANNANEYAKLLPALINDWRAQWQQGAMPFIYVQLPNYMDVNYLPSESDWAVLREAQLKNLSVQNTAMSVTIDLGEWNDIHPLDKKDVGIRSALAAEKVAYGENDIVYSGPIYQSSKIEGDKIIIIFNNTGSGLISNDGEGLRQFAIAGADKKFVWAHAKIDGDKVIVWNDDVRDPKYVRYAWADNPRGANLYNKEGLPASSFRTDE
ncbi:MAG: sialate O-acetylesterase [Ginsengibacter sp.]